MSFNSYSNLIKRITKSNSLEELKDAERLLKITRFEKNQYVALKRHFKTKKQLILQKRRKMNSLLKEDMFVTHKNLWNYTSPTITCGGVRYQIK